MAKVKSAASSTGVQRRGNGTSKQGIINSNTTNSARDENQGAVEPSGDITAGLVQSTVPAWVNAIVITFFIFGGCCSNVMLAFPMASIYLKLVTKADSLCRYSRWKL